MLVFTDASFSRKPPISGCGIVILDKNNNEIQLGSSSRKCKNNNIAEVLSIAVALDFINRNEKRFEDEKTITIVTDSKYAIDHLDQECHINDYEQDLYDYINACRTYMNIKFFHIKGHVHDGTKFSYYNNIADSIAGEKRLEELEKYHKEANTLIGRKLRNKSK